MIYEDLKNCNCGSAALSGPFDLQSYVYPLPEDRIAQAPAAERDASRLMVLDRKGEGVAHARFRDLASWAPEGALIVANRSAVFPARLLGRKPTGGRVEFLCLTPLSLIQGLEAGEWRSAPVDALLKASKRIRPRDSVAFTPDLRLEVVELGEFGRARVTLFWRGELAELFDRLGRTPLPPYIKRGETSDEAEDRSRYQCVYADRGKAGSVAAPTAGLHFTDRLRSELDRKGCRWAWVALHVGYGTFSPVRARDIREHEMHAEHVEIPEETVNSIRAAKAEGRPVIAVGTTTVRALEGVAIEQGGLRPYCGTTQVFISPGFRFHVVDHMVTNFHLPGSSLVIMVSAFAGRERVMSAYAEAVAKGYRFYSYGDAMLIV